MKAIDKLNEMFDIGQKENTPVFKDLTEDIYYRRNACQVARPPQLEVHL